MHAQDTQAKYAGILGNYHISAIMKLTKHGAIISTHPPCLVIANMADMEAVLNCTSAGAHGVKQVERETTVKCLRLGTPIYFRSAMHIFMIKKSFLINMSILLTCAAAS